MYRVCVPATGSSAMVRGFGRNSEEKREARQDETPHAHVTRNTEPGSELWTPTGKSHLAEKETCDLVTLRKKLKLYPPRYGPYLLRNSQRRVDGLLCMDQSSSAVAAPG